MDTTYGTDYRSLYAQHWWWRSREQILMQELQRLSLPKPAQILDVGCGDGLFLAKLNQLGDVYGIEIDESLLTEDNPFRDRIATTTLAEGAHAGRRFNLITACDVIEHIQDDAAAVSDMTRAMDPGGYLLITVPAFSILWDEHDEINHHFRRYRQRQVIELLRPFSLQIVSCRYLFHGIFLPKLAVKWWNTRRRRFAKVAQHRLPSRFLNRTMQTYCCAEYRLTRTIAPPPFGTSVLAIARKKPCATRM